MRERSRDKGRLEDIVFYANNVKKILDGVSYDDFVNDILWFMVMLKCQTWTCGIPPKMI